MTKDEYQNKYGLADDVAACVASWEQALPPMIARKQIKWFLGGLVSTATLNAEDSRGHGPASRIRVGREVIYRTEELLGWLAGRKGITLLTRALPSRGIARPAPGLPGWVAGQPHPFSRSAEDGHI